MKKNEMRTGAQALVESLEKAGTEVLFGYPGGAVLDIFNCLPEAKFQFVLGRHEQVIIYFSSCNNNININSNILFSSCITC